MTTSEQSRLGDAPEEGIKAPVVTVATGNETKFGTGQTIASVVIDDMDRVALAAQTDSTENGIWVARNGKSWERATDMNLGEDVIDGQLVTDANTLAVYSIFSSATPWRPEIDTITFGLLLSPVGFFWGAITGTISNQSDLQAELDAKSDVGHPHVEADITDLGNYSLVGHPHVEADITDLQDYSVVGHPHVEADITDLQAYLTDAPVNQEIYARSGAAWVPFTTAAGTIGEIVLWGHEDVPQNFLECDGQSVNAVTFAKLFAVIGYQYGGSGANFNLPDLRGEFIRGYAHGSGNDPDRAARTDRGDGTGGDEVGTKQADELRSHTHTHNQSGFRESGSSSDRNQPQSGSGPLVTGATGGSETRGRNVQMMYIVRYDGGGSGTLPPQVAVQDNGVTVTNAVELLNFLNFNLESLVANQVDIGFGASPNNATYCPNYTFTFVSTTDWSISGANAENLFSVGRRLRFVDGNQNYFGTILASAFVGGDTDMSMAMEDGEVLTNTITEICLVNGGVNWSPISSDPFGGDDINDIATGEINGIQYWVAVGNNGKLFVSIDGALNWSVRTSQTTSDLNGVAYNPDDQSFLVVGDDAVLLRSVDTTTWVFDDTSLIALPEYANGEANVRSVCYDFGAIPGWRILWEIATSVSQVAMGISVDDAATWTSGNNEGTISQVVVAKVVPRILTGGGAGNGALRGQGPDVESYSNIPDTTASLVVNQSGIGDTTAILSIIDATGSTEAIINGHNDGRIYGHNIFNLDDVTFGSSAIKGMAHSETHERVVAVAEDGKIGFVNVADLLTSDAWTLVDNGANPLADFTAVAWNDVNGIFAAVNNQGQILRSSNGLGINIPSTPFVGWTEIIEDPFVGNNIDHIATGVISGTQCWVIASSTLIFTSTDAGITWTSRSSGVTGAITALQYESTNEAFVVACANGDTSRTTNLTTWVADTTTVQAIPSLAGSGAINGMVWSPQAGLWSVFMEFQSFQSSSLSANADMSAFTLRDSFLAGAGSGPNNSCVFSNDFPGQTIYCGDGVSFLNFSSPVDTSGQSINNMNTPVTAGLAKAGTLGDPQDLFVGDNSGDIELMNGATTRAVNDNAMDGPVNAFAYSSASDRMIAVGDAGEIKTQAGVDLESAGTWRSVETPFGSNINDVDYNATDDMFICVCADGTIARSVDGIS